eukprot:jgi/Botrbrau1/20905/Bobra.0135s0036.1
MPSVTGKGESLMWWQRKRERDETPVRLEHSAESVTSRSAPGLPSTPRRVPLSRAFISGPGSFLPEILALDLAASCRYT